MGPPADDAKAGLFILSAFSLQFGAIACALAFLHSVFGAPYVACAFVTDGHRATRRRTRQDFPQETSR
jgi:hypothetical protein